MEAAFEGRSTVRPAGALGAHPRAAGHDGLPFSSEIDISIVMPCLNEEATVGNCVRKAVAAIQASGLRGEVIVADNGSTDRSVEIAEAAGARVVHQPIKGYGSAYLKGFSEARGRYILMGDSDDTYDFGDLMRFVAPLENGYDLVMGDRFKGRILDGAMPWLHQYIGNPVLSGILRWMYGTTVSDAHCGIRAFTREAYERMQLRTPGMEFASEMVVNASRAGLKIAEVPITYYPREGESKLHSLRDGWRHLRFMLLYSPKHLFLLPGLLLLVPGLVIMAALLPGPLWIGPRMIDIHVMVAAAMASILGLQIVLLGLAAHSYALTQPIPHPKSRFVDAVHRVFTLERGLLLGLALFLLGCLVNGLVVAEWVSRGMENLNAVRPALFASTLTVLGVQIMFNSFFLSLFISGRPR